MLPEQMKEAQHSDRNKPVFRALVQNLTACYDGRFLDLGSAILAAEYAWYLYKQNRDLKIIAVDEGNKKP